jgi:hypothetical protein
MVSCTIAIDWATEVQSMAGLDDFSFSLVVGPTELPVQWVSEMLSLRREVQPGCDADHLPPFNVKVKKEYDLYPLFPPKWFHGVQWDSFILQ